MLYLTFEKSKRVVNNNYNFVLNFRITSPSNITAPRQHVTPVRRAQNQYRATQSSHPTNVASLRNDAVLSTAGRQINYENLATSSADNTKELKKQLEAEREKVKQLSSQLTTNVC